MYGCIDVETWEKDCYKTYRNSRPYRKEVTWIILLKLWIIMYSLMISSLNAPIILIGSVRISLKGRGISLLLSTCFSQETIKKMQRKENNYAVSKCFECFFCWQIHCWDGSVVDDTFTIPSTTREGECTISRCVETKIIMHHNIFGREDHSVYYVCSLSAYCSSANSFNLFSIPPLSDVFRCRYAIYYWCLPCFIT